MSCTSDISSKNPIKKSLLISTVQVVDCKGGILDKVRMQIACVFIYDQ